MGFLIGFGIFLFLLAVLLFLPIYVRLYKDEEGNAKFALKVAFFPIRLDQKEKPKKKDSQVLDQLGLSHYTSTGNLKKRISEKGLTATLKEFTGILRLFFSALGKVARKFRVCRAKLEIVTAGENAAMEYGIVCAILYPLSALLQNHSQVRFHAVQMDVRCDFEASQGDISYDLVLRVFVGSLIPILFGILLNLWKEGKSNEGK